MLLLIALLAAVAVGLAAAGNRFDVAVWIAALAVILALAVLFAGADPNTATHP